MTRFWSVYYQFMILQLKLIFLWLFYPVIFKLFAVSSIIYVLGQPKKWKSWLCSDLTGYIAAIFTPIAFFYIFDFLYNEQKTCLNIDEYCFKNINFYEMTLALLLFCCLEFIVCYFPNYFRSRFNITNYFNITKSTKYVIYIVIYLSISIFIGSFVIRFLSVEKTDTEFDKYVYFYISIMYIVFTIFYELILFAYALFDLYKENHDNKVSLIKFVFDIMFFVLLLILLLYFTFGFYIWFVMTCFHLNIF